MLLDTHVWLWAAAGDTRRIGSRARREIEGARTRGQLYVATISMFEIAALHVGGRLELATSPEAWVRESIDVADLKVVDISGPIALDAGLIPGSALADPCDRLLVAAAKQRAVPLVTCDARILEFARSSRAVRVVDASR